MIFLSCSRNPAPLYWVLVAVVALVSSSCFAQGVPYPQFLAGLPSVQAQLVFEGAQIAGQKMMSYRLVTKLSPERLLAEVESLWSKNERAKVWRTETHMWHLLSKVERFPDVEVLQVRRGVTGETIARLSYGAPVGQAHGAAGRDVASWLPVNAKILQKFSSSDPGQRGYLMIARSVGSVQANIASIEAQALRAGFRSEHRINTSGPSEQSHVAILTKGREEVVLTLDRDEQDISIVLQYSQGAR
jgi:hypothetical protein